MSFVDLDHFVSTEFRSPCSWQQIVPEAVESLSQWLAEKLTHEPFESQALQDGFSIEVSPSANSPMRPSWRGILGVAIVNGKPLISCVMFFVLGNKRLRTVDGKDYSEFVYNGNNNWKFLGTFEDEFGEFSNF